MVVVAVDQVAWVEGSVGMTKVETILVRLGDIFGAGWWVQSLLSIMQFRSPPIQPESSLFRSICGTVSAKYFSLLDLDGESVPEGKYRLARVRGPMLKTIALPLESRRVFSGMKSDLIKEAVPYLEGALLEIIL